MPFRSQLLFDLRGLNQTGPSLIDFISAFHLPNGYLEIQDSGQQRPPVLHPGKDNGRLFHDQIILYGFDPFDAPCDFTRFIDGALRINEAAQLNDALVSFDTDLE